MHIYNSALLQTGNEICSIVLLLLLRCFLAFRFSFPLCVRRAKSRSNYTFGRVCVFFRWAYASTGIQSTGAQKVTPKKPRPHANAMQCNKIISFIEQLKEYNCFNKRFLYARCVYENLWEPWLKFYFYSISRSLPSLYRRAFSLSARMHCSVSVYTFVVAFTMCAHLFYNKQQKTYSRRIFLVFLWLFWALIALNDECVNFRCAWAFPFRQRFIRNQTKWNEMNWVVHLRAAHLFEHIEKNLISK